MMTDWTYNLSREESSNLLGISTRTLDRYIKKWKLSYKKIANRVVLSKEEINIFKLKETEKQTTYWEAISNNSIKEFIENKTKKNNLESTNIEWFLDTLKNKDEQLEKKNNTIFILQHKIWELEGNIKNSISLPNYTEEKEKITIQKEKIELENNQLIEEFQREKNKNILFMAIIIFMIILFIFIKTI
jgi:predicted site-specific integrase-resolvase